MLRTSQPALKIRLLKMNSTPRQVYNPVRGVRLDGSVAREVQQQGSVRGGVQDRITDLAPGSCPKPCFIDIPCQKNIQTEHPVTEVFATSNKGIGNEEKNYSLIAVLYNGNFFLPGRPDIL
jgi:hypothetical protein